MADDVKGKHMSQVQENLWNNITKSCVYLQLGNGVITATLLTHIKFYNRQIKYLQRSFIHNDIL